MNKINKCTMAVLGLLVVWAGPISAAEPFGDSVPLDVVEQLMGGSVTLSRDIPPGFPLRTVPVIFEVRAAADRGSFVTVMLRSEAAMEEAMAAFDAHMETLDWVKMPNPGLARPNTGFISRPAANIPTQFCHEEHGTMSMLVQQQAPAITVNLSMSMAPMNAFVGGRQGCQSPEAAIPMRVSMGMAQQQYMPRLELPREADYGNVSSGTGMGSDGEGILARAPLRINWSPAQVAAFFAQQLQDQGWSAQGDWDTGGVAGSVWTRVEDGQDLLGVLSVLPRQPGNYQLYFRLLSR